MTSDLNRRHFLQTASQTAATLAAVQTLPGVFAAESTQPETVNIAMIGCGGIMTHHLKGLVSRKEAVSISWLCDVDPAQIDRIAKNMLGFQSQAPNKNVKVRGRPGRFECRCRHRGDTASLARTDCHQRHG